MIQTNYRNTKQREYVLNFLKITKSHPTASDIYDKMKVDFPNLSLGTVYRNLNILIQQKKILKLDFGSTFDHYDGNCEYHSHFICNRCHKIYDIEYDTDNVIKINEMTNHIVEGYQIKYYGICEECLNLKNKEE